MRKTTLFLLFAFTCIFGYGQFPNINTFKKSLVNTNSVTPFAYPDTLDPYLAFNYFEVYRDSIYVLKRQLRALNKHGRRLTKDTALVYYLNRLDSLNRLNNNKDWLQDQIDELHAYCDTLLYINRFSGNPKFRNGIMPLRTRFITDFYYDNLSHKSFRALNNIVFQGAEDRALVSAALATGYLYLFRIRLNTTIYASNQQDSAKALIDKVYNGGGLFSLNLDYPLLFWQKGGFVFCSSVNARGASDIPALGVQVPKGQLVGYFEPSVNVYLETKLRQSEMSIFGNFKYGRVFASKAFKDMVDYHKADPFEMAQVYFGFSFNNKVKIAANLPLGNIAALGGSTGFTVGLQFVPNR